MRCVKRLTWKVGAILQGTLFSYVAIALECAVCLSPQPLHAAVVARDPFEYHASLLANQTGGEGWAAAGWKSPPGYSQYLCDEVLTYLAADESLGGGRSVAVHGTADRNNPLRRELNRPYSGDELYVRFLLRYDATSLDNPGLYGNGEFFVLWLDDIDGGDGAGHNPNVPNIGINALPSQNDRTPGKNVFMARIGSENTAFSNVEVRGNHTYLIVARLSKTQPGHLGVFDRLELWVDPDAHRLSPPEAVAYGRGSNLIRWVGFSTGKKTEPNDLVLIDDLMIGEKWQDVVPTSGHPQSKERDAHPAEYSRAGNVSFRRDVYPLLQAKCFSCHQGSDAEAGYRLDLRDEVLGLYQGKPLAIPGHSSDSPLYNRLITDDEDLRMPLGAEPLTHDEIALLRAWIDQGLDWDETLLRSKPLESNHWAFQRICRPPVPEVKASNGIRNPIDAFIAEKQQELAITPAPPANRRTLLRRLSLIYTGLLPTPEELDAMLADGSEQAYRHAVDHFLSSPHYGERWGRHWLDLARWAESDGYQHDEPRDEAWRYRDYVIGSFNENKPYDRFVREQIAGDELEPYEDANLVATGFLAAGRYSGNELDKAVQRNDILVDITNTIGSALLGLTMNCAQCHTHKFDPISARDYYRFTGFFVKGQPVEVLLQGDSSREEYDRVVSAVDEQYSILHAVRSRIEAQKRIAGQPVFALTRDLMGGMSPAEKKRFVELNQRINKFERAWAYYSPVSSPRHFAVPYHGVTSPLDYSPALLERMKPVLLIRGDVDSPGQEVDVGWPTVFGTYLKGDASSSRPRTELADWLFARDNPLTSRVWVNRIWQHHFGKGIVSTPDDFGTQGASPSHPELLDWLAVELIESGWDTAHIQRLIADSATFQQSSQLVAESYQIDPDNQYFWRWTPRRLEAEDIRDVMLETAGLLDRTVGGRSVTSKKRRESLRRTVYLEQKRGELPLVQQLFDTPSTITCTGQRLTSTVPLQPLYLLNDPTNYQYARAFAKRVVEKAASDESQRAIIAFEMALGRQPSPRERQILDEYLESTSEGSLNDENRAKDDVSHDERFVQYCHALLNLNEFLYIP